MAGTATALAVGTAATSTTAATAGLIGIGGSVTTMGVLSAVGTGLGIASSIAGLGAQRAEYRQAASDARMSARDAQLRGLQESNKIKRAAIKDISAATARAGAGGQGDALLGQQIAGIASDASDELSTSRYNAEIERRRRLAQASAYKSAGKGRALSYLEPVAAGVGNIAFRAMER